MGKIQPFEARAFSRKKFLEIWALPGEFIVVTLCYDHDSIIVTADPLWSFLLVPERMVLQVKAPVGGSTTTGV